MKLKLEKLSSIILFLLNISGLFFLVYNFNKGVDLTDESFHLMYANPNQEFKESFINYDIIFKTINYLFGISFSIFDLRIIRLIFTLVSSLYLFRVISKYYLSNKIWNFHNVNLVILILFSAYIKGPISLSYNSITFILSLFSVSFFLKTLKKPSFKLNYFILAILFYFIYITKFTSAFALVFLFQVTYIYKYYQTKNKEYLFSVFYSLVISLIIFSIFFLIYPTTSIIHVNSVISVTDTKSYSIIDMFIGLNLSVTYLCAYFFLGYLAGKINYSKNKFSFFIYAFFVICVYVNLYIFNWQTQSLSIRFALALIFVIGVSFCRIKEFLELNNDNKLLILTLILLPFVLYIGTNNPFVIYLQPIAVFWFLIVVIISPNIFNNYIMLGCFIMIIAYEMRDNIIRSPYRQFPLENCTEIINYNGSIHYVPVQVKKIVDDLTCIYAKSPIKSDYVFGISRLMGDVVLTGKKVPSNPIWSYEYLEQWMILNTLPNEFYLIINLPNSDKLMEYFTEYEVFYIDSYNRNLFNGKVDVVDCYVLIKI